MDNRNLILSMILVFLGLLIYQAWQQDYGPKPTPAPSGQATNAVPPTVPQTEVGIAGDAPALPAAMASDPTAQTYPSQTRVRVTTDVLSLEMDTLGGDLRQARLLRYPVTAKNPDVPVTLLNDQPPHFFILQSGLIAEHGPTHETAFQTARTEYTLDNGQDTLEVPLTWTDGKGVTVTKIYRFTRGAYQAELEYRVENQSQAPWSGRLYGQWQRTDFTEEGKSNLIYTYLGGALASPQSRYEKVTLDEMQSNALEQEKRPDWAGGWLAMVQHYFVAAWIPSTDSLHHYYAKYLPGNQRYILGSWGPDFTVAPGATHNETTQLYLGPKIQENLIALSPGLELTVDYGYLWFIAQPLVWLLKQIHAWIGNWGWSIVLLTVLIKLAFYHLSAASYRSMANMRRLQPKLKQLQDRYGEDRQGFSQAMMELYRKEKVNPLGGCLPVVVQIPVFIALYWVLVESVELRQATFTLWLQDLSSPDPYFVLPLVMGVTMLIQQWLTPAPMDPVQQKIMMTLPIVFTVFFAFFPAGLVLYWVVNNILSISQQWYITRKYADGPA